MPSLDQSRRSSLSESSAISGFSSASARTFVHEASTLVLETVENGVKRYVNGPISSERKLSFFFILVQTLLGTTCHCTEAKMATQGYKVTHLQRSYLFGQTFKWVSKDRSH